MRTAQIKRIVLKWLPVIVTRLQVYARHVRCSQYLHTKRIMFNNNGSYKNAYPYHVSFGVNINICVCVSGTIESSTFPAYNTYALTESNKNTNMMCKYGNFKKTFPWYVYGVRYNNMQYTLRTIRIRYGSYETISESTLRTHITGNVVHYSYADYTSREVSV